VKPDDPSRRDFLGLSGALAAIAIAPGMILYRAAEAKSAGESASTTVRWGMLVDTTRCGADCNACVDACRTENGLPAPTRPTDVQWLRKVELRDLKTGRTAVAPVMCQHCAEPPCVDVCPTGASFKRADGIVMVDRHVCIGCRYCMMACPYKARSFVHEPQSAQKAEVPRGKGCVEACNLCAPRVDRGGTPACVEACAAAGRNAIVFGDLNDPRSEISRRVREASARALRPELRLDPGVRYAGL
jgi:molybdopterin-containing oxidoreductase family iron-sulfur binding subunit